MIQIYASDMRKVQDALSHIPDGIEQAAARAINRAAYAGRSAAARKARMEYYVLHKSVISTITIKPATENTLLARIKSRGPRRELVDFKVNPSTVRKVSMVRVGKRKADGMQDMPGAFVAYGTKTGRMHVLRRTTKDRYPLHIKYGPSVPEMIGSKSVAAWVEERAQEVLAARLDHEIERLLRGAK